MKPAIFVSLSCASLVLLAATATSADVETYKPPRTSWGDPVIQGNLTNNTDVPLERAKELGTKEFWTDAEYAERKNRRRTEFQTEAGTNADVHYDNDQFGLVSGQNHMPENHRTSIINSPEDGRVPPLNADAMQRSNAARAARAGINAFESYKTRPLGERCISWGHEGPPLLPVGYNSSVQIMQSKDQVVIVAEMIHHTRVIPLLKQAPDFAGLTRWQGNSWGHWEGDTLVIETTGIAKLPRGSNLQMGPDGKVVERNSRTGPNSLRYEFTVSDPSLWDVSWGGEYPLGFVDEPMVEYACHEGNYGMANILSGAREDEARAAKSGKSAK
jgi:hypothetical protein